MQMISIYYINRSMNECSLSVVMLTSVIDQDIEENL